MASRNPHGADINFAFWFMALFADGPIVTVRQLEAGADEPRRSTLEVVKRALEAAGVEFIDENGGGPGVRLRKPPSA